MGQFFVILNLTSHLLSLFRKTLFLSKLIRFDEVTYPTLFQEKPDLDNLIQHLSDCTWLLKTALSSVLITHDCSFLNICRNPISFFVCVFTFLMYPCVPGVVQKCGNQQCGNKLQQCSNGAIRQCGNAVIKKNTVCTTGKNYRTSRRRSSRCS